MTSAEGPAAPRFGPVHWFAELDSTNRYLAAEAARGAPDGLVVVAEAQTAGRGRLDRRWDAAAGSSLLVSALVRLALPPADAAAALPLVVPAAALAAAGALGVRAGIDARLKWPNDLVVADRKLAGLLAEVVAGPSGSPPAVVVGMGLNVHWDEFPPELAATATSCNLVSDRPVDRAQLLFQWLAGFDDRLAALADRAGRRALRDACAARSATLGRRVRVEQPAASFEGLATGLDEQGRLEVTRDDGTVASVSVGDVVHLRLAAAQ